MPPRLSNLTMIFLSFMGWLQSCGPAEPKTAAPVSADRSVIPAKEDDKDSLYDPQNFKHFDSADYHVFVRRKVSHYEFTLLEYKVGPDVPSINSPPPPARAVGAHYILLVKDTSTGRKDTVVCNEITTMGEEEDFQIKELTKDLEFSSPVFRVEWMGEDDNIFCAVYGYKGDTLSELFEAGGLIDLKRKDKNTLAGHCSGRDELLYWGRDDYIITVSLPDYSVDVHPPDTMEIDRDTEATDTIYAFRQGVSGRKPYVIFPGRPLHIDTFFYKLNKVTFNIGDSIFLKADGDAMKFKLKGNSAG